MAKRENRIEEGLSPARVFAAALAFMIGLHLLEPGGRLVAEGWAWIGGLPAAAGLGLYLWSDAWFRRHGVASGIAPNAWAAAIFKNVSVPDATPARHDVLLTDGPFRLSRHPMYLGMALALFGLALALGSATPFLIAAVFPLGVDRLHIRPEEAALAARFGETWHAYAARVRRWA